MKKLLKSKINQRIFKSLRKIGVIFLVLFFIAGFYFMNGTNAFQTDNEESVDNSFVAGRLDIEVSSSDTGLMPIADASDLEAGEEVSRQATIFNKSTMDIKYKVGFEKVSGDDDLCNGLEIAINDGTSDIYSGGLSSLDYEFLTVLTSGSDEGYIFKVSLPPDASKDLEDLDCEFNFVFTAWQNIFPDDTQGWTDEEKLEDNEINSGEWLTEGDVVINEIMWMGSDGESSDEWIELRNMTGDDIDLSNWNVHGLSSGSGTGAHLEIPAGYSVKANSYFLILRKKWDETAISLSKNLDNDEGITHKSSISLLNGGEELILKNKPGETIDTAWKNSAWPAGENGTEKRSMERNNIPGDGTVAASWHSCVSGNCNDGIYWDTADGNNYGTPGAANLSPVVMNEFVANPIGDDDESMPEGEWIELYNLIDKDIELDGWYFKNGNGDKIIISKDNSDNDGDLGDEGEIEIKGKKRLVVYLEQKFLNNDQDEIYFYDDMDTPGDETDDILEDVYKYENASKFDEGKSFARFPEGNGIWIDPESTPNEENNLENNEKDYYREIVFRECFEGREFDRKSEYPLCKGIFLEYLGLLDDQYDDEMSKEVYVKMLKKLNKTEENEKNNEDKDEEEEKASTTVDKKDNSQPEVVLDNEGQSVDNQDESTEELIGEKQPSKEEGTQEDKEDGKQEGEGTEDEGEEDKDNEKNKDDEEAKEEDEENIEDGKKEEEPEPEDEGEDEEIPKT